MVVSQLRLSDGVTYPVHANSWVRDRDTQTTSIRFWIVRRGFHHCARGVVTDHEYRTMPNVIQSLFTNMVKTIEFLVEEKIANRR